MGIARDEMIGSRPGANSAVTAPIIPMIDVVKSHAAGYRLTESVRVPLYVDEHTIKSVAPDGRGARPLLFDGEHMPEPGRDDRPHHVGVIETLEHPLPQPQAAVPPVL